jgi:hypothetical protein
MEKQRAQLLPRLETEFRSEIEAKGPVAVRDLETDHNLIKG